MDEYLAANRRLWDEWTLVNSRSDMYSIDAFKAGRSTLHEPELSEVGSAAGKRLLHLQCHFGMDSISWARLGAQVTGVDFSEKAIDLARRLAAECSVDARFVCSNIYDLIANLPELAQFDLVYTSKGVLTWLPDLDGWARTVAYYLKPGGTFYIQEFHPFSMVFDDEGDEFRLRYPYFSDKPIACEVKGSYADRQAQVKEKTSYEWAYPLGKVVTSLIDAGLQIEFLHEFPWTGYPAFPFLEKRADGRWWAPGETQPVPLMFSLRASKKRTAS